MNIFDSNSRHESPMWIIKQIDLLLKEAIDFNSSSKLIYACFETRNLLESIEFNYVFAAVDEAERKKAWETIRKEDGIKKTFQDLDNSIYHYQTFLIELCKVLNIKAPIYFDFKKSRRFKTQLNEYCHIYGRGDEELKYTSDFIKKDLM